MSQIHAPDDNKILENREGGKRETNCPVNGCPAVMNPGRLPKHIGEKHA